MIFDILAITMSFVFGIFAGALSTWWIMFNDKEDQKTIDKEVHCGE